MRDLNIYYYIYKPTNASGDWNTTKAYMSKLKLSNTLSLSKDLWQKETVTVNNKTINRYKYDISISDINTNDVVDVCIPEYNQLYPVVQSDTNKITLYSYDKPISDLNNVTYRKYEGTFMNEDDDSGYMPKVYSKTIVTEPYEWARATLSGTNCNFSYTINDISIKSTDLIEVVVHPDSVPLSRQCKLNPIAITENGRCVIFCVNQPKVPLKFSYNIYHCKSINDATPSQQQYMIKKGIKNHTLNTLNWVKTNRDTYPYLYTISANCTKNDVADIIINSLSQQYATSLYPLIETTNGYINVYSKTKPSGNISIEYYIFESE